MPRQQESYLKRINDFGVDLVWACAEVAKAIPRIPFSI